MLTGHGSWCAGGEGVALVALRTVAHGDMIVDSAQRRRRADAVTGVDALVVLACLVARTFGVRDAFGLALHIRVAEEASRALADGYVVPFSAARIVGADSRVADGLGWWRKRWNTT